MILALRQRHRRMLAVIGVLLPLAFAFGIAARRPVPIVAALPPELTVPQFSVTEWQRTDLFVKTAIQVRLLREQKDSGRFALAFTGPPDFIKPDLLVYWVSGTTNMSDSLPENAVLLGAFDSPVLPLPSATIHGEGLIVLYSLAANELVDVSQRITF